MVKKKYELTAAEKKAMREYRKKLRERSDPAQREKLKAYKKAWNKAHPEKWREYQKNFYARLAAAAAGDDAQGRHYDETIDLGELEGEEVDPEERS